MRVLGLSITRTKTTGDDLVTRIPGSWGAGNGWWPLLREAFTGAWQRTVPIALPDVLTHSTVWSCVTLIASDISKLAVKLVEDDEATGICTDVDSPTFSPILRKPNHYQNRIVFFYCWLLSKLIRGNTYVLLSRDRSQDVDAMYILDPSRVTVLVAPDGAVYYQLDTDNLAGLEEAITVPASEIIHDLMVPLYHPLVGVSPIHACGLAAMTGLKIQHNTAKLFANGSQLSGVLTAPAAISQATAERIEKHWDVNYGGEHNIGKVAVLGDGLKFEPMTMTAIDAQLIDQLKWSDEKVCSVYHVPPYMVNVGPAPTYNNIEALNQQYYTQCLQALIEAIELCLEEGLGAPDAGFGIEFDLDGLLRMDSATKMTTAKEGVGGGILSPNEARQMFNKKPVPGGNSPYLQQQNYSLAALDKRDQAAPAPSSAAPPQTDPSKPTEPKPPASKELSDDEIVMRSKQLLEDALKVAA